MDNNCTGCPKEHICETTQPKCEYRLCIHCRQHYPVRIEDCPECKEES